MTLDAVIARFEEQSPLTVMARLTVQRVLDPTWLDTLFEAERQRQYTRELLFSSVIDLMAEVALGLKPSVYAAARARQLPVSVTALYDKINRTDPEVVRALVRRGAERLTPVLDPLRRDRAPWVPGYEVRIVDGNHLPASEKRLEAIRGFRGAALPGQALVVLDPDRDLVVDLLLCEDAHTQERALVSPLLEQAHEGQIWILDRNFSTSTVLFGLHQRGAAVLVREHACNPNPTPVSPLRRIGATETGEVFEQRVQLQKKDGPEMSLRRIELHLEHPTEDGDTVIRLLTNLPARAFPATKVADLYRRRWTIEICHAWCTPSGSPFMQGRLLRSPWVPPADRGRGGLGCTLPPRDPASRRLPNKRVPSLDDPRAAHRTQGAGAMQGWGLDEPSAFWGQREERVAA